MNYEIAQRIMPDGRVASVVPLTFGRARIVIGPSDLAVYDDGW